MKISERYELERGLFAALQDQKSRVDDGGNELVISDAEIFYGKLNQDGSRKSGILKLNKPCGPLPAGALFTGTFGKDQRPLDGEYRSPGVILKISPTTNDCFELTETFIEGGAVVKSTCGKDLTAIKRPAQNFTPPTRSNLSAIPSELFTETETHFNELRKKQNEVFVGLGGDTRKTLQPLRAALASRELLFSDTMLSELTGRVSEEQKEAHQQLRNGIINRRIDEIEKDPSQEGYGSGDKYGNCLQYAQETQRLAVESGMPNTFVLFGRPDHVFNVVVAKEDKMFLVDSWNGDLMCEFNAENFYKHSSLHAIFDLTINRSTWAENGGCLDGKDKNVAAAKDQLEARMQEIADARFSPEIQEIMSERIVAKLENLDPKDAYYQENRQELLFIADHFGLESLHEKLSSKTFRSDTTSTKQDSKESDNSRSDEGFVERLGLKKSEQQKSFIERMRGGKDGGKSRDGYSEL